MKSAHPTRPNIHCASCKAPATKPCKLHLTLLDVDAKCPICKWPVGDHPTHPSNRPKKAHNEALELRRELAALKGEHGKLCQLIAWHLSAEGSTGKIYGSMYQVDRVKGTLRLSKTKPRSAYYELSFVPAKSATHEWHDVKVSVNGEPLKTVKAASEEGKVQADATKVGGSFEDGLIEARRRYAQAYCDATGEPILDAEFTSDFLREILHRNKRLRERLDMLTALDDTHADE